MERDENKIVSPVFSDFRVEIGSDDELSYQRPNEPFFVEYFFGWVVGVDPGADDGHLVNHGVLSHQGEHSVGLVESNEPELVLKRLGRVFF